MPVYMLAAMPSSELTEWIAEDRIEPIGQLRDDYRTGVIASALVAINTVNGKSPSPLDWFPWTAPTVKTDSPEEIAAGIMKFIEAKTSRG